MRRSACGTKLPWLKHDPRAALTDAGLKACSFAAKGVWRTLVDHLALSDEYGVAVKAGLPMTVPEIARLLGCLERTLVPFWRELGQEGVYSVREDGAFYCRRMVRDFRNWQRDQENGSMGGNPVLNVPDAAAAPPTAVKPAQKRPSRPVQARTKLGPSSDQARANVVPMPNAQTNVNDSNGLKDNGVIPRVNPGVKADSDSDSEYTGDGIACDAREATQSGCNVVGMRVGQPPPVPVEPIPQQQLPMPPVIAARGAGLPKPERREPTTPLMRAGRERVPPSGSREMLVMENDALVAWNRIAAATGMVVASMTPDTRKGIRRILRDKGGLDVWNRALAAAMVAPHWNGTGTSDWRPTVGSFCKPELFQKLLDGAYVPRERRDAGTGQPPGRLDGVRQRMKARGNAAAGGGT